MRSGYVGLEYGILRDISQNAFNWSKLARQEKLLAYFLYVYSETVGPVSHYYRHLAFLGDYDDFD